MLDINEILFEGRFRLFLLGAFIVISVLALVDIILEISEGTDLIHIIIEMIVFTIAAISIPVIFLRTLRDAQESRQLVEKLTLDLHKNTEQAIEWRKETQALLEGLGASINNQFERWKLTPAEKEIGLFLLKGLSHKEVAYIRGVSEATGRQQVRAVYKKAELSGRHDLVAFFLEELALPLNDN